MDALKLIRAEGETNTNSMLIVGCSIYVGFLFQWEIDYKNTFNLDVNSSDERREDAYSLLLL